MKYRLNSIIRRINKLITLIIFVFILSCTTTIRENNLERLSKTPQDSLSSIKARSIKNSLSINLIMNADKLNNFTNAKTGEENPSFGYMNVNYSGLSNNGFFYYDHYINQKKNEINDYLSKLGFVHSNTSDLILEINFLDINTIISRDGATNMTPAFWNIDMKVNVNFYFSRNKKEVLNKEYSSSYRKVTSKNDGVDHYQITIRNMTTQILNEILNNLLDRITYSQDNIHVYDISGYDLNGYDVDGYDREGFNKFGYNRNNIDRDNNRFIGSVVNGKKEGLGALVYSNGDIYYGHWTNDKKENFGAFYSNELLDLQEWKNDILINPSIDIAQIKSNSIEWIYLSKDSKNGLAHGLGDAITTDGKFKIIQGTFIDGKFVRGTLVNPKGDKFNGNFINEMLVYGEVTYSNGNKYIGGLKNNKYSGYGELKTSKGLIYEGNFKEGSFNGSGSIVYPDKSTYEGSFRNGVFDGLGYLTKTTGESYEGTFKDGVPHGDGIYFNGDQIERCEYYNGKRIDQAHIIRQENLRAEEVRREERIAAAKAEEERKKLERERQLALEKEQKKKNTSNFFNGLLLGSLAGGTAGMFGIDVVDAVSIGTSVFIDTVNETPGTTTLNTISDINTKNSNVNNTSKTSFKTKGDYFSSVPNGDAIRSLGKNRKKPENADFQLWSLCAQASSLYDAYLNAIAQGYSEEECNKTYNAHVEATKNAASLFNM